MELCFRVMCLAELVTLGIGVIVYLVYCVNCSKLMSSENWFSIVRVEA